jgi:hypothetical protein
VNAVGDARGEQVVADAAAAGQRQHALVVDDVGDIEDRLCLRRRRDELRAPGTLERAAQLEHDRRVRRAGDVERVEGVGDLAAQAEPAGGESDRERKHGDRAQPRAQALRRPH